MIGTERGGICDNAHLAAAAQVSAQAAAQATVVRGNAVWLPPGSPPITVGGYAITDGMVYVGSAVAAAYAATYEPALIDPRAPVRRVRLDQETPAEGERPAYGDLTPGARAAYLEWLAGGRTDPTPAAHLWLFLYGLERRILVDLAGTLGSQRGVRRDRGRGGDAARPLPARRRVREQAAEFADLLDSLVGLGDPALQPPPAGPRTGDLPMRLRVGIGRYVARRLPISAGWAYAWYAYSPRREWGPAATRRPEEFRRAFAARYAAGVPRQRHDRPAARPRAWCCGTARPARASRTGRCGSTPTCPTSGV